MHSQPLWWAIKDSVLCVLPPPPQQLNVTVTESREQCSEGGRQPQSSKRCADDLICPTLGAFCPKT
jgi:hypothetical protein